MYPSSNPIRDSSLGPNINELTPIIPEVLKGGTEAHKQQEVQGAAGPEAQWCPVQQWQGWNTIPGVLLSGLALFSCLYDLDKPIPSLALSFPSSTMRGWDKLLQTLKFCPSWSLSHQGGGEPKAPEQEGRPESSRFRIPEANLSLRAVQWGTDALVFEAWAHLSPGFASPLPQPSQPGTKWAERARMCPEEPNATSGLC